MPWTLVARRGRPQAISQLRPRRRLPGGSLLDREQLPEGQRHTSRPRELLTLPVVDEPSWNAVLPLVTGFTLDDQRAHRLEELPHDLTVVLRELHHAARAEADRDNGVGEDPSIDVRGDASARRVVVHDQLVGVIRHEPVALKARSKVL